MSASAKPEKDAAATGEGEEKAEAAGGGELLYCGGTSFDTMGRKVVGGPQGNLVSPTRLRPLVGVDIRFVASGCTACHCVALDAEGRCYTWGRNEKGQLGHGDTLLRNLPTVVSELSKQLLNLQIQKIESSPVPCLVAEATNAVCGADFTVWLSSVEGSSILTAGLPQYGQLGHGTDNEYNAKDSSVKLQYDPQPRPRAISTLSGKTIVKVACGTNHTVAVDSSGFVYTWGFGGYGRLGHREQKDEWQPRLVEVFQKNNVLPPNAVVSAGSASSACTAGGGQLYMWGKLKNTGDDWMYPKPLMDLSGWNIRCMASGNMHHVVGADDSCISWGVAIHGELGYGPNGQKSSANPKKVDILEGMHATSVGCGCGWSLIVVDRSNIGDRLDELEIYDGDTSTQVEEVNVQATKKASASTNSRANKRKKNKDLSDSEEDEDESGDDENGEEKEAKGRRGRKPSNRGRGRGAKKVAPEPKTSGRGRGRPKKTESPAQKAGSSGRGGKRGRGRPRK
ncbi:hypothetical protein PR202_ga18704 [Eleusine coracana subsp. coracana]|uniref:Uncharacterized protein n=1 Tax=Eleusine coracana subsp. coracana TaxID=191504 RepID=A0AAV5CU83_ELECO|nr:hypothetical protein PR202_ga18704 [Eleusine coracana subsp. coracana]